MVNKLINNIKEIDSPILKTIYSGLNISALVCILALVVLIVYNTYPTSHIVFQAGLVLFRTGLMFAASSFISGFAIDKIKKQMS